VTKSDAGGTSETNVTKLTMNERSTRLAVAGVIEKAIANITVFGWFAGSPSGGEFRREPIGCVKPFCIVTGIAVITRTETKRLAKREVLRTVYGDRVDGMDALEIHDRLTKWNDAQPGRNDVIRVMDRTAERLRNA
jgi:hypothetical protein